MSCPHCASGLEETSAACPRCGFDFAYCQESFPFAAPPLDLLIDPGQLLPAGTVEQIKPAYERLRERFPQIDLSFCFLRLQAQANLQEFAFWLHNSAPAADEHRAWTLLVVTDLTSNRLTLSPGYALEPFLRSEPWEAILQELANAIGQEEWAGGLGRFIDESSLMFRQAWELATDRLDRGEPAAPTPGPDSEEVAP